MDIRRFADSVITDRTRVSLTAYPSCPEHGLLRVLHQALFTEEMAIAALGHLLKGEFSTAAATLDQLTILKSTRPQMTKLEHFFIFS